MERKDEAPDGFQGRLIVAEAEGKGPESGEGKRRPESGDAGSALKDWAGLLARAGFWAIVIYVFVFQVSVVKGDSMEPNFSDGDRLVIDKLSYRFTDPRPGDVVVFEAVTSDSRGRRVHRDYIKRVIAAPMDEVEIYGGRVHVNGRVLDEPWGPESFDLSGQLGAKGPLTERYKVPPGRYFVLGDHRGDSKDSRYDPITGRPFGEIGFVPARQIKGKVRWRFYPFGRLRWF